MVMAVIVHESGGPWKAEDIVLRDPGPGQVRVRIAGAGLCHSDLSFADGTLPGAFPAVLGHEAAGTVIAAGRGVGSPRVGDKVVLTWSPPCGECWHCVHDEMHLCSQVGEPSAPFAELSDGTPLYPGLGVGAFAEETVVPAAAAIPVPESLPLDVAGLLGCAVATGVGAVLNTARVTAGESVAVIGLGGVGLSAVQGARIAGAEVVFAVDPSEEKRDLAARLGATHVAAPTLAMGGRLRKLTGGRGADHVIECVGRATTIRSAWSLARRGGRVVVAGAGARDDFVRFSAQELFLQARTLQGCVYGSVEPATDIPTYAALALTGELDPAAMVTARSPLADAGAAAEALARGEGARTLLIP
ncbi:zinc-binding dehydrogenase [Actinomadura sp. 6N118]|uniref:zinc-binding dehydrogenase n=1 Tax=Actinomadura sp. 6N118 TaxID=3375151 RepID=UPI003798A3E3